MAVPVMKFAALFLVGLVVWLLARRFWFNKARAAPLGKILEGQPSRSAWFLSIPLALVGFAGLVAAWALLFVAFVCFVYTVGLGVGEIGMLMGVLDPTAGNILFHTTFPAQMFVMGLFVFLLVVGAFQILLGPLPVNRFLFFRIQSAFTLVRRLAALLAIVAALELAKTVMAASILAPESLLEFFARGGETPLTDPTGMALLAAGTVAGAILIVLLGRRK